MKKPPSSPSWLSSAVFYEIYPQSFYDSNGDGVGDIQGVIQKLDYIKSTGCNAIWLNPCFESPFGDAGYDISDFYKVAPRYGTNEDLCELFSQAKKRGMRVVLDLVAGHTSIEHPWFKASAERRPNKYSNWYIWTSSVWETAPAPLQQVAGFSERDGNYITNFFHFQPALNYGFANPDPEKPWQLPVDHPDVKAVHQEMRNIMAYWLEKGADGFRVDMAASLIKLDEASKAMTAFWQEVRTWFDRDYPEAALISEWSDPKVAIQAGFHVDFLIHFGTRAYTTLFRAHTSNDIAPPTGHSFFHRDGRGDIRAFLDDYLDHYQATKNLGFISLPTGNHDISRIAGSRTEEELKVVFAFLLTMPGVPFIYQGDEIGMRHIDGLPSKEGGYCRTGARTPMQWNAEANAGFSKAASNRLYLPIDPDENRPTVASQEDDKDSLLHFVRSLNRLRREHPALGPGGSFEALYAERNSYPFVYLRAGSGRQLVIAINPSSRTASALIPKEKLMGVGKRLFGCNAGIQSLPSLIKLAIPAFGYSVYDVCLSAEQNNAPLPSAAVVPAHR